jgi:cell division protease FtsH
MQLPTEDRYSQSTEAVLGRIAILMGGRCAESIVLGEISTGAENDIERATEIARKMVCEWGMSDKLGPVAFGQKDQEVFLGREMAHHKDYSEQTAITIDEEIRRIVRGEYERVMKILEDNRDALDRLSEALLEHETLDAKDVDALLEGRSIERPKPESRHLHTPEEHRAKKKKEKDPRDPKPGLLDPSAGGLPEGA